jgi:hypothetical protein
MADTQDGPRVHKLPSGFNVTTFPLPPRGMRLTDASPAELAQHGLPPRPHPDRHPAICATVCCTNGSALPPLGRRRWLNGDAAIGPARMPFAGELRGTASSAKGSAGSERKLSLRSNYQLPTA